MEKPFHQRRGLEIRAASAADAEGISALLAEGGVITAPADIADRLGSLRGGAGTVLMALDWGPPTGLVALHWFPILQAARPVAQIDLLLVASEDRRKGIGRLLVKAAAQAARLAGCGTIGLVLGASQPDLRGFCLANGFAESGSRFDRPLRKAVG